MKLKIENFVKISLYGSEGKENHSFISENQLFVGSSCVNNKCSPYKISLKRGIYSFECFGASGNNGNPSTERGRGGITYGMINIPERRRLFLYIGQKGTKEGPATFNGGGCGNCYSYSGGGATDVRLSPGEWNNSESLKSRIMVAAGGGGLTEYPGNNIDASSSAMNSNGGGLIGRKGQRYILSGITLVITNANGGNQEAGGIGGYGPSSESSGNFINNKELNGSFGIGGSAYYGSGGGGGGYFGGGAGKTNYAQVGAGAGGSSYISGHDGCRSVIKNSPSFETSSSDIHYSNIHFFNTRMSDGEPDESNNGEGKIIITIHDLLPVKTCSIYRQSPYSTSFVFLLYAWK